MKTSLDTYSQTAANVLSHAHYSFSHIDRWLLNKMYDSVGRPPIQVRLRNSVEVCCPAETSPVVTIVIQDRKTLLELLLDPELGFGEGYCDGRISVEGDLIAALETAYRSLSTVGLLEPVHKTYFPWHGVRSTQLSRRSPQKYSSALRLE